MRRPHRLPAKSIRWTTPMPLLRSDHIEFDMDYSDARFTTDAVEQPVEQRKSEEGSRQGTAARRASS